MSALVTQSALELITLGIPFARVTQSAVEIITATSVAPPPPNPNLPAGINQPVSAGGGQSPAIAPPQGCALPATAKFRTAMREVELRNRRDRHPYPWIFPPKESRLIRASATIPAPAPGVQTLVLAGQVPSGYWFVWSHILQVYTGAGFVPGSGSITWSVDINVPIGTATPQGMPVQGLINEVVPLGSLTAGPWAMDEPEILVPGDTLRSKVITTIAIPSGAPNFFTSMFLGFILPVLDYQMRS